MMNIPYVECRKKAVELVYPEAMVKVQIMFWKIVNPEDSLNINLQQESSRT
jgi:hypothetical protein